MRIVGIDPGIGRLGWAVVEKHAGKPQAIIYDCFETPATLSVPERLQRIHQHVTKLLQNYTPDALSIEDLFFINNAKTAFAVGQARGVVLLAAAQHSIPVFVYTPLQVKVAVTGYGRGDKAQVGKMVKAILGLDAIPTPDDTADALAIAITHAFSNTTVLRKR